MSEWKSIKDELPPVGVPLIVTVYNYWEECRALRYPVYYDEKLCGDYAFFHGERKMQQGCTKVLAWMLMPEPYREDEDEAD